MASSGEEFQFQLNSIFPSPPSTATSPKTPRPFGNPLLATAVEPPYYSPKGSQSLDSQNSSSSPKSNGSRRWRIKDLIPSQSGSEEEAAAQSSSSSPPRPSSMESSKKHDREDQKKVDMGLSERRRDGREMYYYYTPAMKEMMKKKKTTTTTTALPYRMNTMFGCINYNLTLDSIVKKGSQSHRSPSCR